jgi:hypothetical protein
MRIIGKTPAWETREAPSRLIHVGPHKTGTTTVQSAFHHNREALAANGVHYVGSDLQPTRPVKAVTGAIKKPAEREHELGNWHELVGQARDADARCVVLSSEFLCEADERAAAQVVEDLGSGSVRVVVTLRPLAKILPSQWQQFVQAGNVQPFHEWVEQKLERFEEPGDDLFWRRHRHDLLVTRWAGVVGPDNVSVVIADSSDPEQLPRVFTALTGLPDGVLVPKYTVANRSLTWEEAEAIRHFNLQLKAVNQNRKERGEAPVRLDIARRMAAWRHVKRRTPLPDEQKVVLPMDAVGRVDELAKQITTSVLDSGVEIIGDPKPLTASPRREELEKFSQPRLVPSQVAARVATALYTQAAKD